MKTHIPRTTSPKGGTWCGKRISNLTTPGALYTEQILWLKADWASATCLHCLRNWPQGTFKSTDWCGRLLSSMRSHKARVHVEASLNREQLQRIWDSQRGKCSFTKIPLIADPGKPASVTLYRRDRTSGFTYHNTVLVCLAVASGVSQFTESEANDFFEWVREQS